MAYGSTTAPWIAAIGCLVALGSGCAAAPTTPTTCTSDETCGAGFHCDVDHCAPNCTSDDDCASGSCDETSGRCAAADGGVAMDARTRDSGPPTDCDRDPDKDGDGHDAVECDGTDCDDDDANRYPGNTETCDAEGRDEDCDPGTFGTRDNDDDGVVDTECCNDSNCGTDCDDDDDSIKPGAAELCNGVDDDCNGVADDDVTEPVYVDCDGDGWGEEGESITGCHEAALPASMGCGAGGQYVRGRMLSTAGEEVFDCDGTQATVNPMAADGCPNNDTIDNDCDGATDEGGAEEVRPDCDGDTFAADVPPVTGCHGNLLPASDGCATGATYVRAGSSFDCNDADGAAWQTMDLYRDGDGDSYCASSATSPQCTNGTPSVGYRATCAGYADCNDGNIGQWQSLNVYRDADGDNYCTSSSPSVQCTNGAAPSGYRTTCAGYADCNDGNASAWTNVNVYRDGDGDNYCTSGSTTTHCTNGSSPSGYRSSCAGYSDCDDANGSGWTTVYGYRDSDSDNYCTGSQTGHCTNGTLPSGWRSSCAGYSDCNDGVGSIRPGAPEVCSNGVDEDCNGVDRPWCNYGSYSAGRCYAATSPRGYYAGGDWADDNAEIIFGATLFPTMSSPTMRRISFDVSVPGSGEGSCCGTSGSEPVAYVRCGSSAAGWNYSRAVYESEFSPGRRWSWDLTDPGVTQCYMQFEDNGNYCCCGCARRFDGFLMESFGNPNC